MKYFTVERSDNCIWLTDNRDKKQQIHLTPAQAKEIGERLVKISK